jgi:cytidylate kinase
VSEDGPRTDSLDPVDDDLNDLVIAIDGTAGSGKSSASRRVAQRLGLRYLDTGAMYRAVTWQLLLDEIPLTDVDAIAERVTSVQVAPGTSPEAPTIGLGGTDVSTQIRSDEVTAAVSAVSAVPRVRDVMVDLQRAIIGSGGIVVEGRDIGTVVVPHAAVKVYLTAHPAARARRRSAELAAGQVRDLTAVEQALRHRDAYDSTRPTAPLSAAADAVVIDTTMLSLDDVVDQIVGLVMAVVEARSAG